MQLIQLLGRSDPLKINFEFMLSSICKSDISLNEIFNPVFVIPSLHTLKQSRPSISPLDSIIMYFNGWLPKLSEVELPPSISLIIDTNLDIIMFKVALYHQSSKIGIK